MRSSLKLATYNIHRCYGTDGAFDPQRISRVIEQLDADVIALQEVETFFHGGQNVLDTLTDTGFTAIAGPTMYRGDSSYGNAVLTRLEPANIEQLDISVPGKEPRAVVGLRYTINGTSVHIITTHLGLKYRERRLQMQWIYELMERHPAELTVLMGDINEWFPWGRISKQLSHYFGRHSTPTTFPSFLPVFALDQIWSYPPAYVQRPRTLATPLSQKASDHLPVHAILQL